MIDNPCDLDYPQGVYKSVTIKCRLLDNGTWEVWCTEWKCTLHSKNLTACVANLLAEIECHNAQEQGGEPSPFSTLHDQNKWREKNGFVRLKANALAPAPKSQFGNAFKHKSTKSTP